MTFFEMTLNSLSISRIHYEFIIHYLFCKLTLNQLSFTFSLSREFTITSLFFYRMKYRFREITIHSLSLSLIRLESTIVSAKSLKIPFFANSLWIHFRFRQITSNSLIFRSETQWIVNIFRIITMNLLSLSLIHIKFIILFAKSL